MIIYCSSLFVYLTKTSINRIEQLFNMVMKKLLNVSLKTLSIYEQNLTLKMFNIMPFKYRLLYRFSWFAYKIYNKILLKDYSNFFLKKTFSCVYEFRKVKIVDYILVNKASGENCLSFFICKFLNLVLSSSIKLTDKLFKYFLLKNLTSLFEEFEKLL